MVEPSSVAALPTRMFVQPNKLASSDDAAELGKLIATKIANEPKTNILVIAFDIPLFIVKPPFAWNLLKHFERCNLRGKLPGQLSSPKFAFDTLYLLAIKDITSFQLPADGSFDFVFLRNIV